jgi:branched-chain amino acid transport system substrate-binding protein
MKYLINRILFICLMGWMVLAVASTPDTGRAAQRKSKDTSPVIVGVPLPLSGNLKEFGTMMQNSFEISRDSINKLGGVNGRPLKLVYVDTQGKEALGEDVVKKLVIDYKAIMLVGGYSSSPTYVMARTAQRLDVPFLISTASADKITQKGWKNIFRLNPPISEYTKGLEDFWIKNFRPKSMAIIYENSMFGTNGAMRMMSFCEDSAIEVSALIGYDREMASQTYFRPVLAPLTEETPDVIYMISYLEDAVALVKTIRELKLKSLLCGGAGGFTLEEFVRRAGDSANYLLTATLWSEHLLFPGAKEYYERYVKLYGAEPDYHGAEAYSALLVVADGLKRAESFSPRDIRSALNKTFMLTPFGPVKFYSYEDFERQNSVRTLVTQIINGRFETIWPPDLATSQFLQPGEK